MSNSLRITVLIENKSSGPGLKAEHGLSMWVETGGFRFLFDTGQSSAFISNAAQLGIKVADADAVAISHGHYDHTGGLGALLKAFKPPAFHLHPNARRERYIRMGDPPHKSIGMPSHSLEEIGRVGIKAQWTTAPTRLTEKIGLTGPVPRLTDFEDVGGPFFMDAACGIPDDICDDQAAWVETEDGIVVLLGCAHSGVVNTLDYVSGILGERRIKAVIGGMHLLLADERRLRETISALRRYKVGLLAPCHCTGDHAIAYIREHFAGEVLQLGGGSRLQI
ncbi:MAG TPA: MBL fold metallo-hydrolase [Candidatus Brocadiia bacterium]|nr:MBL fold metallo-hydrolase [Candidatus Brocadiia bacterium]